MNPDLTSQQWADELAAAHEVFYRQQPKGELMNVLIIEAGDGYHYELVPCGWSNGGERTMILALIRMLLQSLKATRYAFMGEVWLSKKPDDYARPSLDPEREERVFTAVADRRLAAPVVVCQKIIRGRSGGVRKLLRDPGGFDGVDGALANLFPQEGLCNEAAHQHQRAGDHRPAARDPARLDRPAAAAHPGAVAGEMGDADQQLHRRVRGRLVAAVGCGCDFRLRSPHGPDLGAGPRAERRLGSVMMLNMLLVTARTSHVIVWLDGQRTRLQQIDEELHELVMLAVREGVVRAMAGEEPPTGPKGPTIQ